MGYPLVAARRVAAANVRAYRAGARAILPQDSLGGWGIVRGGALLSPSYDFGGLWRLAGGFFLVALAVLYLVPEGRHQAMLGGRAAVTLAGLAFALLMFAANYYPAEPTPTDGFFAVAGLTLVPIFFSYNYSANRRRARRSRAA